MSDYRRELAEWRADPEAYNAKKNQETWDMERQVFESTLRLALGDHGIKVSLPREYSPKAHGLAQALFNTVCEWEFDPDKHGYPNAWPEDFTAFGKLRAEVAA